MILCVGNYGLGAYDMGSVHNREPERSRVAIYIVVYKLYAYSMMMTNLTTI